MPVYMPVDTPGGYLAQFPLDIGNRLGLSIRHLGLEESKFVQGKQFLLAMTIYRVGQIPTDNSHIAEDVTNQRQTN